jgi:quinol monooxygenase YgiN
MTTLDPNDGYVVLINTFKVEPDRAEELLGALSRATEHGMRQRPGFVSANLAHEPRPPPCRQLRAMAEPS